MVSVPHDATLVIGNYASPFPIVWLYCVSLYPAPEGSYYNGRLDNMVVRLPGRTGLSDHTPDVHLAKRMLRHYPDLAYIEKHFCYDENLRGKTPDSGPWSMGCDEFKKLAEIVHG
jgi:sialic acid synthase SpsE